MLKIRLGCSLIPKRILLGRYRLDRDSTSPKRPEVLPHYNKLLAEEYMIDLGTSHFGHGHFRARGQLVVQGLERNITWLATYASLGMMYMHAISTQPTSPSPPRVV